jgi:UDPglucose 6-dehydrogenase
LCVQETLMNIAVIGTGYVGLVSGTCLAEAGNNVVCMDIDEAKIECMRDGEVPIYEPGLKELFSANIQAGRLRFTTDLADALKDVTTVFLALPTPPGADGSADLTAVLGVAGQLGPLLHQYTVIIDKSTVPVGTAGRVRAEIATGAQVPFDVVSNPEFLREGFAIQDFMHPDRVVVGTDSDRARTLLRELYEPFIHTPGQLLWMDTSSAELTKYAANAFLALKVTFINEIANLCERLGADVETVGIGIGADERIGKRFLQAGIGYGGSCFPKDVLALHKTAQNEQYDFKLLNAIIATNAEQKQRLAEKVVTFFGDIRGKHFALWGLAFKPDTDDIREAPALEIIQTLLGLGATINAYDPEAIPNTRKVLGEQASLSFADSADAALEGADALLIATEWQVFRTVDAATLRNELKQPIVFDGRNLYSLEAMREAGLYYESIGRSVVDGRGKQ